mmetsp:Transcript_13428/g.28652  ORF Transcript_13428/g.28652 Transcript_13428/m.28652 type:complete len:184 (+) Transcript_13428:98-649(+)
MGLKDIKHFTAEEVGMWLTAQGLGEEAPRFVDEGVDGGLLLTLGIDDFKNDLGLSSLQTKKLMRNIEFTRILTQSEGGASNEETEKLKHDVEVLEGRVCRREEKIKELTEEIKRLKMASEHSEAQAVHEPDPEAIRKPEPEHAPAPTPKPSHHQAPPQRRGPGVVGGAARGAAGGAVKGAIGE